MSTSPPAGAPPGLTIRAARIADFEGLAAISAMPGFQYGTLRLPFRSPDETRRHIEGVGPEDVSLVAVLDGEIVGNCSFTRFKGRRSHVASIGMGVHDGYVGRGIGTALLAALIDAADRWYAVRRLELSVYADNVGAIHLYRRCGFVEEGVAREAAFRAGRYADLLYMARIGPVGAGA